MLYYELPRSPTLEALFLASGARRIQIGPGDIVLAPQTQRRPVFYVLEGVVKYYVPRDDGFERIVGFCGPGSLIGESLVFVSPPLEAVGYGRALTRVVGLAVHPDLFRKLLNRHPELAERTATCLALKVNAFLQQLRCLTSSSVLKRLSSVILSLSETWGNSAYATRVPRHLVLPLTQDELGRAIGASRVAVCASLRKLKHSGAIATKRRLLLVKDPGRLRKLHALASRQVVPDADAR